MAWPRVVLIVCSGTALILAAAACGGDDDDEAPATATTAAATATAAVTEATKPAATATTAAASPSASATAAAARTPTAFEARLAKAYTDSRTFMTRASTDALDVKFESSTGAAIFTITPSPTSKNTIGGNSGFLGGPAIDAVAITAQSALVAGRVTWKDFPEVKRITVTVVTEFTLNNGTKLMEPAATIAVNRATGEKMDFDALKATVGSNGRLYFCAADGYVVHIAMWGALTDKGCMTARTKP